MKTSTISRITIRIFVFLTGKQMKTSSVVFDIITLRQIKLKKTKHWSKSKMNKLWKKPQTQNNLVHIVLAHDSYAFITEVTCTCCTFILHGYSKTRDRNASDAQRRNRNATLYQHETLVSFRVRQQQQNTGLLGQLLSQLIKLNLP